MNFTADRFHITVHINICNEHTERMCTDMRARRLTDYYLEEQDTHRNTRKHKET
jgi:hypothetical protein